MAEESAFFKAVAANRNAQIKTILKGAIDVNERNQFEQTPLQYSIYNRNYELFITLLYLGANPLAPGENEEPLLEWGLRNFLTDPRFAEELVKRRADVNGRMSYGRPLISDVIGSDEDLPRVQFLVNHGADVNAPVILPEDILEDYEMAENMGPENNKTPLYFAIRNESPEIVKFLVGAGARIDEDIFNALTEFPNEEIRTFLAGFRRRHALAGWRWGNAEQSRRSSRLRKRSSRKTRR
jgi:ankyrin repeat protein